MRARFTSTLSVLAFALAMPACRATPPAPAAQEPTPAPIAVHQQAATYLQCWDLFSRKDWAAFPACYEASIEVDAVDSGRPPARGVAAAVQSSKDFVAAFPDVTGTPQLVLASPGHVAGLTLVAGTHTAALSGIGNQPLPATGRTIAYTMGLVVEIEGLAITKERQYADGTTLMTQLGVINAPARPVTTPATTQPVVVVASGSDAERANVETFRANMAAFNAHDTKTLAARNATDAVFHDYTQPKDTDSAGNLAMVMGLLAGFPDAAIEATASWGAGDYVVTEGAFSGTNTGPAAALGIRTPTRKAVKVRFLEIARMAGGKVAEDWLVFDTAAFAQQLGLAGQ